MSRYYRLERRYLPVEQVSAQDHPLRCKSIINQRLEGAGGGGGGQRYTLTSGQSLVADPLLLTLSLDGTDPLSQFVRQDQQDNEDASPPPNMDPLSQMANEYVSDPSSDSSTERGFSLYFNYRKDPAIGIMKEIRAPPVRMKWISIGERNVLVFSINIPLQRSYRLPPVSLALERDMEPPLIHVRQMNSLLSSSLSLVKDLLMSLNLSLSLSLSLFFGG